MILFEEQEHKYFHQDNPDKKWLSVSGLFDLVKNKFDTVSISEKYAKKGKEKILKDISEKWNLSLEECYKQWGHLEFTPEDIQRLWLEKSKSALSRGTTWHKDIEKSLLEKGCKKGYLEEGIYRKSIPLDDLEQGEYIELIIPYPRLSIVGTADRVKILPNKEFIIRDWKSDAKLEYKGTPYYDDKYKEKRVRKLLPPLHHIDDVNGQHYNVKESLYIYFLESYGYTFKEGFIDHVIFDKDLPIGIVTYPIDYLKKEVHTLLNHFKKKNG